MIRRPGGKPSLANFASREPSVWLKQQDQIHQEFILWLNLGNFVSPWNECARPRENVEWEEDLLPG